MIKETYGVILCYIKVSNGLVCEEMKISEVLNLRKIWIYSIKNKLIGRGNRNKWNSSF